jgi:hypothetical protein
VAAPEFESKSAATMDASVLQACCSQDCAAEIFLRPLTASSFIFRCGKNDEGLVPFAAAATNETLSSRDAINGKFSARVLSLAPGT